tara:strand:+ start:269 stop:547 length:279 start_codon:yes stop_codon:yes gene_type:complete
MVLTEKFASLELEIEDLKSQINWYEKGLNEIYQDLVGKPMKARNYKDAIRLLAMVQSIKDGEPTTADPYNSGDDIEYNYSNKVGKRITFESI